MAIQNKDEDGRIEGRYRMKWAKKYQYGQDSRTSSRFAPAGKKVVLQKIMVSSAIRLAMEPALAAENTPRLHQDIPVNRERPTETLKHRQQQSGLQNKTRHFRVESDFFCGGIN